MKPYYLPSNLKRIPDLIRLAPKSAASYLAFENEVYNAAGAIPAKTKELIAIAVAHVTGCPYCIDAHVRKCKELGGTAEEIVEAVLVAASTRAGAILSHATHALIAFDGQSGETNAEASGAPPSGTTPDCLC